MGFIDKIADLGDKNSNDPELLLSNGMKYYGSGEYEEAAEWFEKAAELGNPEAQYRLACMYDMGEGVPEIQEKAVEWYLKAAEQDHPEAALSLGFSYMFGDFKDPVKSFSWFRKAYDLGQKDSAFFIGKALLEGDGTERDAEKALEYLKEASDIILEFTEFPEDNYRAPLLLAETYDEGELVPRDEEEAVRWYEIAAERDCDEAVERLVELGRREKPKKKGLFGFLKH